jgi:hypothetical protein
MSIDKFTPQRNYILPFLQRMSRLAIGSSSDFVSTWVSGEIYHDLEEVLNSIKSIPSLHWQTYQMLFGMCKVYHCPKSLID